MIVLVDIRTILQDGDLNGKLIRYSRPFLWALKDIGWTVVIKSQGNNVTDLKKRLQIDYIQFDGIDHIPFDNTSVISEARIIQIEPRGDNFSWVEVKDGLEEIITLDYQAFSQRYFNRLLNEPEENLPERDRELDRIING